MNLFIDTNIYLSFYHYSNDDLEQLRKLFVAISKHKIILFLTEQVKDEFKRNREVKIADALRTFTSQNLSIRFPQFCKNYPEYKNTIISISEFEKNRNILLKKVNQDTIQKELSADKMISLLFTKATLINRKVEIIQKSIERYKLGNPPGKKDSYGDAINWEMLLKEIPNGEDLFFISDDKDFFSALNSSRFSEFLNDEWSEKKQSKLHYYKNITDFFAEHFPNIKLATDLARKFNISSLETSTNFSSTHNCIAKLAKYTNFTEDELDSIVNAILLNDQVNSIAGDDDVRSFIHNIIKIGSTNLANEKKEALEKLITTYDEHYDIDYEVDIPF